MSKLYSSRYITKVLERQGFVFISQRGSHAKYRKSERGKVLTAIVPVGKKEIPLGTFRSILRQSNLYAEDFKKDA